MGEIQDFSKAKFGGDSPALKPGTALSCIAKGGGAETTTPASPLPQNSKFDSPSSQERRPLFQPMSISPAIGGLLQVPDAVNENGRGESMTSGLSSPFPVAAHCETGADGGSMPPSRTLAGRSAPETYQSLCARRGVDGFVSAVDAVLDRATESDEPEWGDSDTSVALSAGIVRGTR